MACCRENGCYGYCVGIEAEIFGAEIPGDQNGDKKTNNQSRYLVPHNPEDVVKVMFYSLVKVSKLQGDTALQWCGVIGASFCPCASLRVRGQKLFFPCFSVDSVAKNLVLSSSLALGRGLTS